MSERAEFSFDEKADIHLIHGLVECNNDATIEQYLIHYPDRKCPTLADIKNIHDNLKTLGKFCPSIYYDPIQIDVTLPDYTCEQKTDMHLAYGYAERNASLARQKYGEKYTDLQTEETFELMDQLLRKYGGFHPLMPTCDIRNDVYRILNTSSKTMHILHTKYFPDIRSITRRVNSLPAHMVSNTNADIDEAIQYKFNDETNLHLLHGFFSGIYGDAKLLYKKVFTGHFPSFRTFEQCHNNLREMGKFLPSIEIPHILANDELTKLTPEEKADMHHAYSWSGRDLMLAKRLYRCWYPERYLPAKEIFSFLDKLLRKYGGFHPMISLGRTTVTTDTTNTQPSRDAASNAEVDENARTFLQNKFHKAAFAHRLFGVSYGDIYRINLSYIIHMRDPHPHPTSEEVMRYHTNLKTIGKFWPTYEIAPIKVDNMTAQLTCAEKTNMHYIYGLADQDVELAVTRYRQIFPGKPLPAQETFQLLDQLLRDYGGFHPMIGDDGEYDIKYGLDNCFRNIPITEAFVKNLDRDFSVDEDSTNIINESNVVDTSAQDSIVDKKFDDSNED